MALERRAKPGGTWPETWSSGTGTAAAHRSPIFRRPCWLREAWSGQHNVCTSAEVNKAPPSCTLGLPLRDDVDPKAIFHARRPFLQRRHRRGDARNSAPAPAPWHILVDLHHRDRRAARRARPRRLVTTNVSTVLAPRTPLPEIPVVSQLPPRACGCVRSRRKRFRTGREVMANRANPDSTVTSPRIEKARRSMLLKSSRPW